MKTKKQNSSVAAYEHKQLMLAFLEPELFNEAPEPKQMTKEELKKELEEWDRAIAEAHGMFLYFKEKGNKEEMRFWREMEQQNKTEKRLMREKYSKEVAVA